MLLDVANQQTPASPSTTVHRQSREDDHTHPAGKKQMGLIPGGFFSNQVQAVHSNPPPNYYNSPGRLAVFRRKFENVTRRTGVDPATFAMELEILAVRGFGDMGTCARNRMVRDMAVAGGA